MIITPDLSRKIIRSALKYIDRSYIRSTFNCAHFVANTYEQIGIVMPKFHAHLYPPADFNLTHDEFENMPVGHSIFLRRKTSVSDRIWTHVAIIYSQTHIIHCSHHFGDKVTVTPRSDFIQIYGLVPKLPD